MAFAATFSDDSLIGRSRISVGKDLLYNNGYRKTFIAFYIHSDRTLLE